VAALAIPVVTRVLGPADYGRVALAITIQLLLGTLASLGLPPAILRFFYDRDRDHDGEQTARALISSTLLVTLGVISATLLTGLAWLPAVSSAERTTVVLGVLLALPMSVLGACMALLRAQERPYAYMAVVMTSSVGAQVLGLIGLLITPDPSSYLVGCLIAVTVAAVAGLWLTGTLVFRPADRSTLRAALAYGLPTVPHSLAAFVLAFGDRVVIALIDGAAAVGRYQVAFVVGFLGVTLLQAFQTAWIPVTFAANEDARWASLADVAAVVARLAAFVSAGIALLAEPIFSVLVPSSYDPHLMGDVAALAALSTVLWATYLSRAQVLLWTKQTRALSWITPTAALLNIVLVAVLLPVAGLRGAALATVAAVIVQAYLTDRAARPAARVPWRRRAEIVAYVLGAIPAAVALVLPSAGWATAVRISLAAAIACAFAGTLAGELKIRPRRPDAVHA
jgi:O-antigen/teichoic acid export membrane protein